jgi:predicted dehydrogenase
MDTVRLGIIGAGGGIAKLHLSYLGKVDGVKVAALADVSDAALQKVAADWSGAKTFTSGEALIDSGAVDAILIATPHFDHPTLSQHAFARGVHVLCEKPMAVTALDAQTTNEKFAEARKKHPRLLYAGMFNQRNQPQWKEIKRLCTDGSLGKLLRASWTITSWFRTQAYYDSGGWRATWKGEGGGVLINQCPHNLDLFCWFLGLPQRVVAASVGLGKYHHIEVEDDVNALLEFSNGATGTFITSTGQSPGINRLEIVGTGGTIICDDGKLTFLRADTPVDVFTRESTERFGNVPVTELAIKPGKAPYAEHETITRNFIATLLKAGDQQDLVAPATEGIHGLELGNAMLMSGLTGQPVNLPSDRRAFADLLKSLQEKSTFRKNEVVDSKADLSKSFA